MKNSITDFTEAEFIGYMEELLVANKTVSDDVLDDLLERFCKITEHPDGTDLIYYPENGSAGTAEDVTRVVKEWRSSQGLPGFKG
ncbi:bacteriocin immunity protein [Pseudomonas sp. Choline-02u-1]|uniref:bacteriocin immunity protein n=1 Tax=Pseudomonas sp. Choline-02u-1 TaxID=2058307 RepID=UPI000C31E3A1|nr:bacteriocin immunity protein [Pseudomonas sp. Choline-02u-1]PKH84428.1 bacteriocin immunity protein [Pseudomonas sp. Choline-02u-1]